MATTTNLTTLKINYLTQEQYDTALANSQINANELYFTPEGSATPLAHAHGYITNLGAVTTTATMSTSDNILFADASDSTTGKVVAGNMRSAMSVMINSLEEGTSASNANDYIITQYAGGGTTTTSYYRRKLSNVLSALDKYHTSGS